MKWYFQRLKNIYHWLVSVAMVVKYRYPAGKLKVIGITGTDGKTTTCTLVYEILRKAGGNIKPALLSTVSAKIGDEEIETGLHTTNPDARLMQPLLARMVAEGVTHLVLEVTAHGLDQYRVWGCNFNIGVLTNVTHEHLNDFVDMGRYRKAKSKLFQKTRYAVLNKDDDAFNWFRSRSRGKIIPYGKSDIKDISPALAGDYNRYNIAAAVEVARILKIQDSVVKRVVKDFAGVPGRREEVKTGQNFRVIVDFAHTPNGLDKILSQVKKELSGKGKMTVVFGCPGERDKSKRPLMGKAAAIWADRVIITADDPRWEDMGEIYDMAISGMTDEEKRKAERVDDRLEAIKKAVSVAGEGDIVVLAGKGHEKSLAIKGKEIPWSDVEAVQNILH
jgi:UDP-N-acetylmuramoyl-L-alanyl-D-glutamate--2,6-diaminopimelate ligase